MTLIISWIGVDKKKEGEEISSIYITSDSRYSWNNSDNFDYGIKVFGSINYPEIFGFCGDVLFPTTVLGQLLPQIDNGLLLNKSDDNNEKNKKIFAFISSSLTKYPKKFLGSNFTILHGTRNKKQFSLFKTAFTKRTGLSNSKIDLPLISTKIFSGGSGSKEFERNWLEWSTIKHNDYGTSRAVYHCLNKTLKTIKDPRTGGIPQIIGLYRAKNTQLFGIVDNGKKYIYGKECLNNNNLDNIEWRNENFERTNPKTTRIIEGAQRQPS